MNNKDLKEAIRFIDLIWQFVAIIILPTVLAWHYGGKIWIVIAVSLFFPLAVIWLLFRLRGMGNSNESSGGNDESGG